MAQYTKLQANEVHSLAHQYGLQLTDYAPIVGGAANSSFLLNSDTGQYILTICENSYSLVHQMGQLLLLLAEYSFPAPRIQPLSNGELLTVYRGKPVFLKRFISGQIAQNPSNAQLAQCGQTMAFLHKIPVPDYLPNEHEYITQTYPRVIKDGKDFAFLNWLAQRYVFLTETIPSTLPKGLIHGDLFFDNVLFEANDLKAFLDFEDVCYSFKMFDIGMAIVGMCTSDTNLPLEKVRAFVNGYQNTRVLTKDEKDNLQYFIELAALLTATWRYWKYHLDAPDAAKAQKHLQMVEIAKYIESTPQSVWKKTIFQNDLFP